MLVDSHCHLDHLDLSDREGGINTVLEAARARGVSHFLSVAVDMATSRSLIDLTAQYDNVYSSVGAHPLQKVAQPVPTVDELVELASQPRVVAIGETGLDNFYSSDTIDWQRASFINHLKAAQQVSKPVIIHTRDAREETIELMREYTPSAAGVMHCFTESWEMAEQALELGFYISFSGIVTFASADQLRDVASRVRWIVYWLKPTPPGWLRCLIGENRTSPSMFAKLPSVSLIFGE